MKIFNNLILGCADSLIAHEIYADFLQDSGKDTRFFRIFLQIRRYSTFDCSKTYATIERVWGRRSKFGDGDNMGNGRGSGMGCGLDGCEDGNGYCHDDYE